ASNTFTGSNGTGEGFLGLELVNGTGNSLTSFSLSYDGEQWTRSNAGAQTIAVQYSLNATSLTTGTWTTAGAGLTFTAPQVGNPAVVLDGNASANRASLSGTVSSINWTSGSTLWIRFVDLNDSGSNDLTLAIDNVSFTAVPEPASALLGALGLLGLVRRRR
ncbi:MAG TPA: PEP-CTERM sorting domain-containing protein, partial [Luteolibacter sp.]|nr:PEP-CTERM sorting domain-containing protein [Luteolibacter sp.]